MAVEAQLALVLRMLVIQAQTMLSDAVMVVEVVAVIVLLTVVSEERVVCLVEAAEVAVLLGVAREAQADWAELVKLGYGLFK